MLYVTLFILSIGFYVSNFGKIIRFIFSLFVIKSLLDNLFIDFSLSFWLFILLNLPIVFKLSSTIIKKCPPGTQ